MHCLHRKWEASAENRKQYQLSMEVCAIQKELCILKATRVTDCCTHGEAQSRV
jgi:hypothetical protein